MEFIEWNWMNLRTWSEKIEWKLVKWFDWFINFLYLGRIVNEISNATARTAAETSRQTFIFVWIVKWNHPFSASSTLTHQKIYKHGCSNFCRGYVLKNNLAETQSKTVWLDMEKLCTPTTKTKTMNSPFLLGSSIEATKEKFCWIFHRAKHYSRFSQHSYILRRPLCFTIVHSIFVS